MGEPPTHTHADAPPMPLSSPPAPATLNDIPAHVLARHVIDRLDDVADVAAAAATCRSLRQAVVAATPLSRDRARSLTVVTPGPAASAAIRFAARVCPDSVTHVTLDAGAIDRSALAVLAAARPRLTFLRIGPGTRCVGGQAGVSDKDTALDALIEGAAASLTSLTLAPALAAARFPRLAAWTAPPRLLPRGWGRGGVKLTALKRLIVSDGGGGGEESESENDDEDDDATTLHLTTLCVDTAPSTRAPLTAAQACLLASGASLRVLVLPGQPLLRSFPVALSFSRLTRLDVSECPSLDGGLAPVFDGAPRLALLSVRRCASLSDGTVLMLARGPAATAHRLHSVDVTDCHRLTDASLVPLAAALAAADGGGARVWCVGGTGATDAALAALCGAEAQRRQPPSTHPPLTLDVTGCATITPAALASLADGGLLPRLACLRAGHATLLVSASSLPSRSTRAKPACTACGSRCGGGCAGAPVQLLARRAGGALTSLVADGVPLPPAVAAALGAHCSRLARVSAIACPGLSDAGLVALSAGCALTSLSLGGGGGASADWRDAGAGLAALAPGLRELCLSRRPHLTDGVLAKLLQGAPSLTALRVAAAPRITDAAFTGHALVCLRLTCCDRVTGGVALASSSLTELRLAGCSSVDAAAVPATVTAARRLRVLELPSHVSNAAVPAQAPGAGHLSCVRVEGGSGG